MKAESHGYEELLKPADELFQRGEIVQALEAYQRVREVYGSSISADTLSSLKRKELECLYRLGRYEESLKAIEKLRSVYEAEGDTKQLGWLLSLKAYCLLQLSRLEEGRKTGQEAKALLENTTYNLEYGLALKTLGNIHMGLGNLREAKKLLIYSIPAFERVSPIPYGKVISSKNLLGQVCFMRGETKEALSHLKEALKLCEERGNKGQEAMVKANLGTVYRRVGQGQWFSASKMLRSSLKLSEELNDSLRIARKLTALCRLYILQRRWDKASEISELLERAQKIAEEGGYQRELATVWETRGWLEIGLYQRDGDSHHLELAEEALLKALQIGYRIAPEGDVVMEASEKLGWTCLLRGNLDAALSYGERSLRIARRLGSLYDEGLVHRLLGAVYQAKGKRRKAKERFSGSISLLEEAEAQYDLAVSLLYSGKVLVEDAETRSEGFGQILQAKKIFETLKVSYWLGRSWIDEARGRVQGRDFDKASQCLATAKQVLKGSGEKEALKEIVQIRAELNKTAAQISLSVKEEINLLEELSQPSNSLDSLLKALVKTSGDRAFVGVRGSAGGFELRAYRGIEEGKARDLLGKIGSLNGDLLRPRMPIFSSSVPEDLRLVPLQGEEMGSLMMVPLGMDEELDGLFYVDRLSNKPFQQKDLNFFVLSAGILQLKVTELQKEDLLKENLSLRERLEEKYGFGNIVTVNPRIEEALRTAQRFQDSELPILIQGETGTGKELIARAIHYSSQRRGKSFVPVNCAAFTDTLLESEFFGHKKGSFTNALQDKKGLFEEADGGTLFLDEVANASEGLQAKLLRVLEEMEIRKVGETKSQKVDVGIISATNRDLAKEVEAGRFHKDLYYRLTGLEIKLPPLRERKEDIQPLVDYFLNLFAQKEGKLKGVTEEALELLTTYNWPGNVRQLKNEVERTTILANGGWITPEVLSEGIRAQKPRLSEEIFSLDLNGSLGEILKKVRREVMENAVKKTGGNRTKAARLLGITREALSRRLKEFQTEGRL